MVLRTTKNRGEIPRSIKIVARDGIELLNKINKIAVIHLKSVLQSVL